MLTVSTAAAPFPVGGSIRPDRHTVQAGRSTGLQAPFNRRGRPLEERGWARAQTPASSANVARAPSARHAGRPPPRRAVAVIVARSAATPWSHGQTTLEPRCCSSTAPNTRSAAGVLPGPAERGAVDLQGVRVAAAGPPPPRPAPRPAPRRRPRSRARRPASGGPRWPRRATPRTGCLRRGRPGAGPGNAGRAPGPGPVDRWRAPARRAGRRRPSAADPGRRSVALRVGELAQHVAVTRPRHRARGRPSATEHTSTASSPVTPCRRGDACANVDAPLVGPALHVPQTRPRSTLDGRAARPARPGGRWHARSVAALQPAPALQAHSAERPVDGRAGPPPPGPRRTGPSTRVCWSVARRAARSSSSARYQPTCRVEPEGGAGAGPAARSRRRGAPAGSSPARSASWWAWPRTVASCAKRDAPPGRAGPSGGRAASGAPTRRRASVTSALAATRPAASPAVNGPGTAPSGPVQRRQRVGEVAVAGVDRLRGRCGGGRRRACPPWSGRPG